MSRIRGKDTTPEKVVRSLLHRLGYRFRLHRKIPISQLPVRRSLGVGGSTPRFITPDIVLVRQRVAIFVHGCFWHRHDRCKYAYTPKSRVSFWKRKFEQNVARDKVVKRELRKLGWKVVVVWQCQAERPDRLLRRLGKMLPVPEPMRR